MCNNNITVDDIDFSDNGFLLNIIHTFYLLSNVEEYDIGNNYPQSTIVKKGNVLLRTEIVDNPILNYMTDGSLLEYVEPFARKVNPLRIRAILKDGEEVYLTSDKILDYYKQFRMSRLVSENVTSKKSYNLANITFDFKPTEERALLEIFDEWRNLVNNCMNSKEELGMNENTRFNEPEKIKFESVDFTNHNFLLNIIDMQDLLSQVEDHSPMTQYKNNQIVKKGNTLLQVSYTTNNNVECVSGSGFLSNTLVVQNSTPVTYKVPLNDGCYDYLNSSQILELYRDFKESQLEEDYISEGDH